MKILLFIFCFLLLAVLLLVFVKIPKKLPGQSLVFKNHSGIPNNELLIYQHITLEGKVLGINLNIAPVGMPGPTEKKIIGWQTKVLGRIENEKVGFLSQQLILKSQLLKSPLYANDKYWSGVIEFHDKQDRVFIPSIYYDEKGWYIELGSKNRYPFSKGIELKKIAGKQAPYNLTLEPLE